MITYMYKMQRLDKHGPDIKADIKAEVITLKILCTGNHDVEYRC